jgi:hypothetical protein
MSETPAYEEEESSLRSLGKTLGILFCLFHLSNISRRPS